MEAGSPDERTPPAGTTTFRAGSGRRSTTMPNPDDLDGDGLPLGGRSALGDWFYCDGVDKARYPVDSVNSNISVMLAQGVVAMDETGWAEQQASEASMYD